MLGKMNVNNHPQRTSPSPHPHPPQSSTPVPPGRFAPSPSPAPSHHSAQSPYSGPQQNQGRPHNAHGFTSPPPPQNYGLGPPPRNPAGGRPTPVSRPPVTPQPPPQPDPNDLYPLFRAANVSNSGALSATELSSALVNGDYTSFDPHTIALMIRMFDRNNSGTVSYEEFLALWRFLAAWRELFDRFDEDKSGKISKPEFSNALRAFGYNLSDGFVTMLFRTFETKKLRNRERGGSVGAVMGPPSAGTGGMSFDLFVQACISLKRMTEVFKGYDDDRDGYVTLSFEEFLSGESLLSWTINPEA